MKCVDIASIKPGQLCPNNRGGVAANYEVFQNDNLGKSGVSWSTVLFSVCSVGLLGLSLISKPVTLLSAKTVWASKLLSLTYILGFLVISVSAHFLRKHFMSQFLPAFGRTDQVKIQVPEEAVVTNHMFRFAPKVTLIATEICKGMTVDMTKVNYPYPIILFVGDGDKTRSEMINSKPVQEVLSKLDNVKVLVIDPPGVGDFARGASLDLSNYARSLEYVIKSVATHTGNADAGDSVDIRTSFRIHAYGRGTGAFIAPWYNRFCQNTPFKGTLVMHQSAASLYKAFLCSVPKILRCVARLFLNTMSGADFWNNSQMLEKTSKDRKVMIVNHEDGSVFSPSQAGLSKNRDDSRFIPPHHHQGSQPRKEYTIIETGKEDWGFLDTWIKQIKDLHPGACNST